MLKKRQSGFTLLEVLIAVGVLFIVGSAVVSLSNTLIQGTILSADTTITNLWSQEGLELVTKIRDDNFKNPGREESGEPSPWLAAAADPSQYGWYALSQIDNDSWKLERVNSLPNDVAMGTAHQTAQFEQKVSGGLVARRLICIEAVGASSPSSETNIRCNTDSNGASVTDGSRSIVAECAPEDVYCQATQDSLNRNSAHSTVIPAGNAVKVRAVMVWPNRSTYRARAMSMFVTNWRSYDQ